MRRSVAVSRPFAAALGVSAAIHLSMVSIFSIEIWFPRYDIPYYSFKIVPQQQESAAPSLPVASSRDSLRLSSPDRLLASAEGDDDAAPDLDSSGVIGRDLFPPDLAGTSPALQSGLSVASGTWSGSAGLRLGEPPPIQLPRLEFADLTRLRSREESLRIRSRFSNLFEQPPQDSWSRFSRELRGFGEVLTRWTGSEPSEAESRLKRASHPAPGFSLYVEWLNPPRDRNLLFSPPIPKLLELDPDDYLEPLALVFAVDPQGKVVEVQIPIEDDAGVLAAIGGALLQYRFAPLSGETNVNQRGTLLVAASRDDE